MIDGLLLALTPYLLMMTLAGVSLGIIWGALPGLSTTMAMGLLIGLSAGMSQEVAISFMLGVYTGSVFGGAISAVLINIPGTPDAVPTMIEGHQLAQRGEGGQALGMSIAASFIDFCSLFTLHQWSIKEFVFLCFILLPSNVYYRVHFSLLLKKGLQRYNFTLNIQTPTTK